MIIHIHHHHHIDADSEVLRRLDAIDAKLDLAIKQQDKIMTVQSDIAASLAKVQADVAAQTTVAQSLATYVKGLQAQLAAIAAQTTDTTTADALNALSTQIEANSSSDAGLIVQNTAAAGAA